jgi:GTP cyclohydrolase I
MAHERPDAQGMDGSMTRERAEQAVRDLLVYMGEDITREGLRDTPARVARAMREMSSGLQVDARSCLGTVFKEPCDQMILVRGVRFVSMCEHHLLPFVGEATVAYFARDRIVGLSKIPRMIDALSRRPQVQERLTQQIARTLSDAIDAKGVGVLLRASHSCMGCRGARQPDADMVTSCLLGVMRDEEARAEFIALAGLRSP